MAPPLELYLLTFNCARSLLDSSTFARHLFKALPKDAPLPDIVVLSLQEIAPLAYSFLGEAYFRTYLDRVTTAVQLAVEHHNDANERYVEVMHTFLGMTGLILFAKQSMASRIDVKGVAGTGVGLWEMGNKGAAAVRIGYVWEDDKGASKETEMAFVAAHLAPMEDGLKRRNQDWERMVRNLVFVPTTGEVDVSHAAQRVDRTEDSEEDSRPLLPGKDGPLYHGLYDTLGPIFIAGDLNYRTSDVSPSSKAYLTYPQPSSPQSYHALLQSDQLTRELHAGRTLHNFTEAAITFPPTYKYSTKHVPVALSAYTDDPDSRSPSDLPGSADDEAEPDHWNWAKHRYPSWCDRILFCLPSSSSSPAKAKLEVHKYTALPLQPTSDHRPVALSVAVTPFEADEDNAALAPFPLNPHWASQRAAARRREVVVGVLAWLALSREGNAVMVGVVGAVVAGWWFLGVVGR